jgi:hypothetical protein
MEKQTRRELIISILKSIKKPLSCAQITLQIAVMEDIEPHTNQMYYLSGSVSSQLARMIKAGELEYAPGKAIKGGHLYRLKTKP